MPLNGTNARNDDKRDGGDANNNNKCCTAACLSRLVARWWHLKELSVYLVIGCCSLVPGFFLLDDCTGRLAGRNPESAINFPRLKDNKCYREIKNFHWEVRKFHWEGKKFHWEDRKFHWEVRKIHWEDKNTALLSLPIKCRKQFMTDLQIQT